MSIYLGSNKIAGNVVSEGGSDYELPIASKTTLGGIKVGDNLTIDADGTLNAQAGGGSSEEIYSTEETRIGTWLGKPLYRKAYNFTTSSSALNMQIKIDNIDYGYITMTDKSVLLDNIGNSKSMPMNFVTSTTFICRANVQYTSDAGWFVYFVYPSDVKNKKGIVVVEYTKTTD